MGASAEGPAAGTAEAGGGAGAAREVLVVDDVPEICDFFETLLRRVRGLDVRLTTEVDAERALALVRARPFDLVVSDYRMRNADGVDVLRAAHAANPRGHRVLMTGYNEIPVPVARIREARVDAYVQKPLRNQELLLLLLDLLNGNAESIDGWRASARELEEIGLREERALAPGSATGAAPVSGGVPVS